MYRLGGTEKPPNFFYKGIKWDMTDFIIYREFCRHYGFSPSQGETLHFFFALRDWSLYADRYGVGNS